MSYRLLLLFAELNHLAFMSLFLAVVCSLESLACRNDAVLAAEEKWLRITVVGRLCGSGNLL